MFQEVTKHTERSREKMVRFKKKKREADDKKEEKKVHKETNVWG